MIFVASIAASYEKETELSSYQWKINLLDQIKGKPLDTLFSGNFCGEKYRLGDTVIIYGYNDEKRNWTATGQCHGNKIIGRKQWKNEQEKEHYAKAKNLVEFELDVLHQSKKHLGDLKYQSPPIFLNKTLIPPKEYNFNRGLFNVKSIKGKLKVAHVLIEVNEKGKRLKVKYLNRVPRKIRKSICKFLKQSEWTTDFKRQETKMTIIESFIYPKGQIDYVDF